MLVYMESDDDNANMSTYALITSLICCIIVCNNDQWVLIAPKHVVPPPLIYNPCNQL